MKALNARLPAVLRGTDHPADAAEALTFAQFCYDRKLHAASSRLFAEALRTDPKLADYRQIQHPYNAACAAALAGCGREKDDPSPDEEARAKLRTQALSWLKGELAAWSRTLEGDKSGASQLVRGVLEHWKKDSDLSGVRDPDALAKLPDEEKQAWRTLWREVNALLRKVQGDRPSQ